MRNKFSCIEKKYCGAAPARSAMRNYLFVHENRRPARQRKSNQSPLAMTLRPLMRSGWIS